MKFKDIPDGSQFKTSDGDYWNSHISSILDQMKNVLTAKGHDYGSNTDRWSNFREAERLGIKPVEGAMVRLTDKYCRLFEVYKKGNKVAGETLNDTLRDFIGYSVIIMCLLHEEKLNQEEVEYGG